jgi:hypothetical protein
MRTQVVRAEVERLLHQVPFRSFILALENGETVRIEHPENIAFDPGPQGSSDFYVLTGRLRLFSTFEAVASLSLVEAASESGGQEEEGAA